jgi:integrase
MYEPIKCYLVKPSGRSHYWKMRFQLPGEATETQRSLKVRDKRTAERLMSNFITEQDGIRHGLLASPTLTGAANTNLELLLRAHLLDLKAQKCDAGHVETRGFLIRRIARDTGWKALRDISAASFVEWREKHEELAPRTLNNYFAEMRAFLNWLKDFGKLSGNPLKGVRPVKAHEKARARRAITDDEIARLLAIAPPERRMIYLIALHTGLRRKEIKLLEWQDLFLDGPEPFIKLRAFTTKNRKGGEVTIHPELRDELRNYGGASPLPGSRVVKMFFGLDPFKKDLAAAGISFVERNLRFDLHAMRKTFNTRMAVGNVPARTAMHAMRHSDIKLTTIDYIDSFRLNVAAHVGALPPLLGPVMVSARASGESESEGNWPPLGDTVSSKRITLELSQNQDFSHSLTQSGTLCLEWKKSSLTRART